MEDSGIIELYFARNEQAIRETDSKYGKLCLHISNNILCNAEDAEECVNDTYLAVWNKIPPTRPCNFSAFLCKIVRNLSLKKMEFVLAIKRNRNATLSFAELESVLPDHSIACDTESEELIKAISRFLADEKEIVRHVFIRRYFFFDSVSDIAKCYSFTESKVKNMLYHTRNRLRDYLRKEGLYV